MDVIEWSSIILTFLSLLQVRETAADVIAELADMADPAVLKPYLIKTTGPLIRVVGDRFPSNVKASILQVNYECMHAQTQIFTYSFHIVRLALFVCSFHC